MELGEYGDGTSSNHASKFPPILTLGNLFRIIQSRPQEAWEEEVGPRQVAPSNHILYATKIYKFPHLSKAYLADPYI